MDNSIASLNRSTFEERQKNVSFLRSVYFLLAFQLLICVAWALICIYVPSVGVWVARYWGIALACGIICLILILAVYFVPALNNSAAGMGIYVLFTLLFAYVWGYFCSLDTNINYGWYVLLLLLAIAIGFAAYTL